MPISSFIIPSGAQIPASGAGASAGGGLIVAIDSPASLAGTTYDCEYSRDQGTTWIPVKNESGTARQITLAATAGLTQIDPPIRADLFRLNSDTNETADRTFYVHVI
jgi:hypothetical protein